MTIVDIPPLVPARMLNEFTFCERLFFLEWVDRLWTGNADTVEGDYQHRRVDAGGGAAPLPAEGDLKAARSLLRADPTPSPRRDHGRVDRAHPANRVGGEGACGAPHAAATSQVIPQVRPLLARPHLPPRRAQRPFRP